MTRSVVIALATVLLGATSALALGSHEPIAILGNGEFTEANGVLSGSGTEDDPYIIAGWEIDVPSGEAYGIKIENTSAHVIVRGVVVSGANAQRGAAIRVGFASNVTLDACAVSSSFNALEIASSTRVTARSLTLYAIGLGLHVTGEAEAEYDHDIDESNQVNDRPIRYVFGGDGGTIDGERLGHLTVAASRNVTITSNDVSNGDGIHLAFVQGSTVEGNLAYRNRWDGIQLYKSHGNTLRDNEMGNNRRAAMTLLLSDDNAIVDNRFLANDYGLILTASDANRVEGNLAAANPTGIEISGGSSENIVAKNIFYHENTAFGVVLELASGNVLRGNAFAQCETGILLSAQADYNTVEGNTIVGGAYALQLVGSHNVIAGNLISLMVDGILFQATLGEPVIRENTFRDNVLSHASHRHVTTNEDSAGNRFFGNAFLQSAIRNARVYDLGRNAWAVDGRGNFWADYEGTDEDDDGIGDDAVTVVPAGTEDTAPVMGLSSMGDALGVLGGCGLIEVELLLGDGTRIERAVLVADEAHERFTGYRGFPEEMLGHVPGILFVYEQEVGGGPSGSAFTMETVTLDLDIAFFDGRGHYVGGATMEAGSETRYTVEGAFRYALELPVGSLERLGIDDTTQLVLSGGS
ncbi:MAG: right-handed parallel beta-helix repeat-containing protein [Candidatus Bipolaricaulota bacterium]|nr:MAG: right-handed parallel beta-helix repeat-containing protein [Candidatus Bipolaricaulota bacterium]